MSKLENKVAIITGASKGIGAAIAKHYAAEGAKVVVNYASSKKGAEEVVTAIKENGGEAIALQGDVTQEADITALFEQTVEAFGTVDILVNNAGVYEYRPIEDFSVEHFRKGFDINVLGALLATREAVKLFGNRGGNIINISSTVSETPLATGAVYSASKAAIDAAMIALSKELGGRNIRINSILPGAVLTEGSKDLGLDTTDFGENIVRKTPLGRFGQPNDIAKVVVFLASDDAAWITGEKITVAGGLYYAG